MKINRNQYKHVVFRVHSVGNIDFDENYDNDGRFFMVLDGKMNANQWKIEENEEDLENKIERGSNHVVYDVVAVAFVANYDDVLFLF